MDLSKAFDCIPHDLLIAKMEAYGFSEDFFTFLYPYLKRRKQSVNVSNVHSMFQSFTIWYPAMVHSGTAALHYFYK